VGNVGVAVGGTDVGGSGVAEAGGGVSVGSIGVLVGRAVSLGAGVGDAVLVTGAVGVKVGRRVLAGTGVAPGARARKFGRLQPRQTTPSIATAIKKSFWFMVCRPQFQASLDST
jgi:hypothetical protein